MLRQACAKRPRHCASPFLTTKMAPWTSETFLCWPKIRLSVPIFAVSVALGANFKSNCAQLNKIDVCWTHFCPHDAQWGQFSLRFGSSEPRILQYLTAFFKVFLDFSDSLPRCFPSSPWVTKVTQDHSKMPPRASQHEYLVYVVSKQINIYILYYTFYI